MIEQSVLTSHMYIQWFTEFKVSNKMKTWLIFASKVTLYVYDILCIVAYYWLFEKERV